MADKEKSTKQDKTRAKDWTFVAYPESLPENWMQIMQERFEVSKAIISPLHDKDKNEDLERTDKKPHYHVILRYGSMKSFSQICEITDALNQPVPQKVRNIEGAVRYLVHIDNLIKRNIVNLILGLLGMLILSVISHVQPQKKMEFMRK